MSDEITLRIEVDDTTYPGFPPEFAALGKAVATLNDGSEVLVQQVEIDSDEWPPEFRMTGHILPA